MPSGKAHPYHLQIDNSVLGSDESVNRQRWVAQSFVPERAFFVSRVSLNIRDESPSDALSVSIRSDVAGVPATTNLTGGSSDAPSGQRWHDFDLSPYVELLGGQTYWIVAHSDRASGDGYLWWNSGDDLAYPNGTAAISGDGFAWSGAGKDYSFRVYGFVQPSFSFAVGITNATLRPLQTEVFRVDFANLGPPNATAAAAWVNVSLPPALMYISDDAAAIGGTRSGAYSYRFVDIAPGVYAFNITVTANGGYPDGASFTASFTLDGKDHNGASLALMTRGIPLVMRNARLSLALTSGPAVVDPGDVIVSNVTVTNVGSDSAFDIVLEGSVDPNATYVSSTPAGVYDGVARAVRWTVPLMDPGQTWTAEWSVRVLLGTRDRTPILSSSRGGCRDATNTPLPNETASTSASVRAPEFAPVLSIDPPTAERGDEVRVTLLYDNTGSVAAPWVWTNWNLGGHYELVALVPALPYTTTADGFWVYVTNVSPGPHGLLARLLVTRGMTDGLPMGIQVNWEATDGNGNPLPRLLLSQATSLRAPLVTLGLTTSSANGTFEVGSRIVLNVVLRNVGRAAATGWLNLSLPSDVYYVVDDSPIVPSVAPGRVTWTFPSLAAGSVTSIAVTLRLGGEPRFVSFRFAMNYTDGKGSAPVAVSSNGVGLEVVPTASWWDSPGLWLVLAAGAALAVVLLVFRSRFSSSNIEQVFVADKGGVLLAQRSHRLLQHPDEDILAGMFTAVQDFVSDSFGRGADGTMHAIEFGDRRILVEQGRHHYVAVVYRGKHHAGFEDRVRKLSREIDRRFGDLIPTWDGRTEKLDGLVQLLPQIWGRRRGVRPRAS